VKCGEIKAKHLRLLRYKPRIDSYIFVTLFNPSSYVCRHMLFIPLWHRMCFDALMCCQEAAHSLTCNERTLTRRDAMKVEVMAIGRDEAVS